MKLILHSTSFVTLIFILLFTLPNPAEADIKIHLGNVHLGIGGHSHRGHYYPKYKSYHRYSRHSRKNYYSKHHKYHYGHTPYSRYKRKRYYKRPYANYRKPCHQVSKTVYDEYDIPHTIAGTMCYDRYGDSYIVSGSRYHVD